MSSLSPPSERVRTVVERICLLLPLITPPAPSSDRKDTPKEPPTDDESSRDLLPKQEQVVDILETHGGRLWQADIVTHTEWSKSTVSRVLSEMEAAGEIHRFQSGRKKVVCLTEATPELTTDQQEALAAE